MTFESPSAIREGHDPASVHSILQFAESESQAGRWVALALSYEAAPAFDSAAKVHQPDDFPLIWAASFETTSTDRIPCSADGSSNPEWTPLISRGDYSESIARIRQLIAQGDTYQVNYTFPMTARLAGDSLSIFDQLGRAQGAGFCAWLNLGRVHVLSLSPELFFERRGDRLVTRPMKGTLPRGRFTREDDAQAAALKSSPKNRAENVMIVDMLRNDLGKIAVPGTVQVTSLFDVEKYRTIFQMTSTVEAQLRDGLGLADIMTALFPCASVTGAPKLRTMEIIRELEPFARGLYTGAIGFLKPGGDAIFNVAIRTITLDTQTGDARYPIGGGITWDSTDEDEYQECLNKAAFLAQPPPEFELLESLLLENGAYFLAEGHLARLKDSCTYFEFPFPEDEIRRRLEELRIAHADGSWKCRLLLNAQGAVRAEAAPAPAASPVRLALAAEPVDSKNRFLFHKTTNRSLYEAAKSAVPNGDDILLWNERGELTESTRANLVVEMDGRRYTPPLDCGLLPGVFRSELLRTGELVEQILRQDDLHRAQAVYLINSVRKWNKATCI
ncbi:MAG: aminodeoxychorismate synthase, component I [Lentisphaerae bacterium GWF2_57_35]|nr:MAG: aminodeoxychorismate synthase, component I [Lentisphaerae bacterium GWF2_57_35]